MLPLLLRSHGGLPPGLRVVLAKRVPLELLVHEDPLEVRVIAENDAVHVVRLPLEPIHPGPDGDDRAAHRTCAVSSPKSEWVATMSSPNFPASVSSTALFFSSVISLPLQILIGQRSRARRAPGPLIFL